jgi:hypothetical protein
MSLIGFRSRPDGTKYPIHAPKGRGGTAAVAVGTALLMAAGGGGAGTATLAGSIGSSSAVSAAESAVIRGIRANLSKAKQTARSGKPKQAWRQLGLRQGRKHADGRAACWALSFGEVQEFFLRKPCQQLDRLQFEVTDDNGNAMAVLVSRVKMPRSRDAYSFKRLIDVHGTGDIRPVLPDVHFTGHHYDSEVSGRSVIVAETEPLRGNPSDQLLETVAEAAVVFVPR